MSIQLRNRFAHKTTKSTKRLKPVLARVMNLPENVVAGTHNTEEGLSRRLALYREQNSEEDSIINYFDELEIHPHKIGTLFFACS